MKAIINRNETFGTLNGVITKNEEIRTVVNQHLKEGKAKLLIDTEDTLMYELGALDVISNVQSIQRIIEIPIHEVQNENARNNWGDFQENQCCLCGKKVGKNPKYVHYLTNGNIVSYSGDDIENSQGCFPVGSECAKKLVIQFAF